MAPNATAGFDISSLVSDDSTIIDIIHPSTGEPIPGVKAKIYGPDSDQYRAATHKADGKFQEYARKHKGKFMPPEQREELDKAKIVACTESVSGLAQDGKPLTDVAEIFRILPFIYEQCRDSIVDRAGFIKGSSPK